MDSVRDLRNNRSATSRVSYQFKRNRRIHRGGRCSSQGSIDVTTAENVVGMIVGIAFSRLHRSYPALDCVASSPTPMPQVARLTLDGAGNHHPTWSPDGSKIAFAATHAARPTST